MQNRSAELKLLIDEAMKKFNALTPAQQVEHRRAQRKSYVIAEMMMEHPYKPRTYFEEIYERICL